MVALWMAAGTGGGVLHLAHGGCGYTHAQGTPHARLQGRVPASPWLGHTLLQGDQLLIRQLFSVSRWYCLLLFQPKSYPVDFGMEGGSIC